ncbi:FtsH protease activity modulator HflK [Chromobacterium alticapitis]|uniref:Protein HflK n=1 Tax=Chromobacterium alticapitis TaxID=2073169 RepID=A0A2S5DG06_9NEIS|nr:FtsH protease activity modulator HflK [Chromobacterium alticapitis]POZ61902.1 FtsH protease activity modulator HflK [Chromobacterium alticapitis]
MPNPASPPDRPAPSAFAAFRLRLAYTLDLMGMRGKGGRLLAGMIAVAWLASGIYRVEPDEQGVVQRFGRWSDTTSAGLHYHLPWPLETVQLPKVTQIKQLKLANLYESAPADGADPREKQMLTGDENIVEADCAVFWRIKDAGQFLFRANKPEEALRITAEGALREVISRTPIQAAMSNRRQQVAEETRGLIQQRLDEQQAGILITQVQLQRVDPPAAVIDAFNDVQRARADQERARNEAQAYSNDILPKARGEADRIRQEAEAYRSQVVNLAQGEAKRFDSVYQTYAQAKDVTAWRLYLESMDDMLKKASKVVIDGTGKNGAGVLPLLQLQDKPKAAGKESR